ncbi:Golgi reassembly-stacking protein 2 isoform X1 [Takifugu rubripes]|uniref:Golgi reassembly-stacking protein 2 isoform X1 n=1 Tax=Takifugu rubripes TaxID=31033 RepID=UPI00114545C2|nr:Golgi reassembly-stacking protein 2 isoform X1 [Takifugu rubripes]
MGAAPSVEIPGGGQEGYNVLKVHDNSPGHQAGLEPFFDFIISICDTRLNRDNDTLIQLLNMNVERPIKMLLYSSKTLAVRETTVVPSSMWGGQGLIGVSIRFCSFDRANENVWHILEVERDSPAALAGLRAQTDYIIGTDTLMNESDDLFSTVEEYQGKELKLYVYNTETDNCREVLITPNGDWGGDGSLGCSIGYGYLHRVPRLLPGHSRRVRVPSHTSCRTPEGLTEVSLSAVIPTEPIPSTALGQPLLSSNPTVPTVPSSESVPLSFSPTPLLSVVTHTAGGSPPFPNLDSSNMTLTDAGRGDGGLWPLSGTPSDFPSVSATAPPLVAHYTTKTMTKCALQTSVTSSVNITITADCQ